MKLTRIHVLAIAVSVWVVVAVIWFFALLKPINESIAQTQNQIKGHEDTIHACLPESVLTHGEGPKQLHKDFENLLTDKKQSKYQVALDEAKAKNDELKKQLAYWKKTLHVIHFKEATDDEEAWLNFSRELDEVIRPEFDEFMRSAEIPVSYNFQPDAPPPIWTGIRAPSSSFIKLPSSANIEVQVRGTYAEIIRFLNHLTTWNRLIAIGTIKLSGLSPNIVAAFPASIYMLADVPEDVLSKAGAAAAGGMGGTMPTGMGGMMGGPGVGGGMMMGGPPGMMMGGPPGAGGGGDEDMGDVGTGRRGLGGGLSGGGLGE